MKDGRKTVMKPVAGWADTRVADLLSKIRSPGLPRNFSALPAGTDAYVFEYLEGETLRQLGEDVRTSENLERWFDQVLDSLALMSHCAGLPFAHLDLSPENIIITGEGRACLIDFESARFLDGKANAPDQSRKMTAGYAAPEVYFGRLCPETDLYSLAMTVLAAFSGRMAAELEGRTIKKVMHQLGRPFAGRLNACLSEDPAHRRQAAAQTLYGVPPELPVESSVPGPDLPAATSPSRPSDMRGTCPFLLVDCPFLQVADRLRKQPPGMLQ